MALTAIQREVCRLLAETRVASGESYVAGAAALNALLESPRLSRDVDLFHDTEEALETSWAADRRLLENAGFEVRILRERPFFVEAQVSRGESSLLMQWARDSAYRFFPLVRHDDLGLVLHPFDLATNKVLALVGRLEVRDWVDVIHCHKKLQPLGFLAWAACGKDPGFSPAAILQHAGQSARYSAEEVRALSFEGSPPDAAQLARVWHQSLTEAEAIIDRLPSTEVGTCVLAKEGGLFRGSVTALTDALEKSELHYHRGSIRGALPRLVE
ncbi:MAG TPA: hypothetical protein VIG29_05635 [Vicinamibacteria bacterium]|jgi:hypothetical protein